MDTVYNITFTTEAEHQKMAIPIERRESFDRALFMLARNPIPEQAKKLDEALYMVRLTQWITVEYFVSRYKLVINVIEIRDDHNTEPMYYE